jgi:hypothetical protein
MNNELTLKYRKIFMGKKERPLYVPPSLRQEQSQAASSSIKGSTSPKPRLEVKLSKKEKITHAWEKEEPTKEKITHAWEKEEPSKEKIVHAWEKEEPSTFKLPSKPNKDKSNQSGKKGKIHYNLQRTSRKERQDSTESLKNLGNGSEIPEPSASSKDKSGTDVTFVSAKDYLAEMANSDWNDLDELDYSKVPQWNH